MRPRSWRSRRGAVAEVRRGCRGVDLLVQRELAAGERDSPSWRKRHRSSTARAAARGSSLAIAPGLTIGLVRPSGCVRSRSMALNGRPVPFDADRRALLDADHAQTSAKTNGFDTLMIVNSCSASPAAWTAPSLPTSDAEEVGCHLLERGIDGRDRAVASSSRSGRAPGRPAGGRDRKAAGARWRRSRRPEDRAAPSERPPSPHRPRRIGRARRFARGRQPGSGSAGRIAAAT